ncbi:MAG: DegT/DnrJ/EryC1/StrS family aminotransferase, partial [Bradymonadia bacterium]
MNIPMLDLARQHQAYRTELHDAARRVIDSNQFIMGNEVARFEANLSVMTDDAIAIGVSSGTDALLVALMGLGVGPGTEVVVPAFSFFASAGVVARLGAKPVFADICPDTFNVTDETIAPFLGPKTRVVMPVYLFGQMTPIGTQRFDGCEIPVLEDAAQSLGARLNGKGVATAHAIAATSFFPTKNLGGFGDGGAVFLREAALAERLKILRTHGAKPKYTHHQIGGNFRLDAIHAALLDVKLRHLNAQIAARRSLAAAYDTRFREIAQFTGGAIKTPSVVDGGMHTYNQYVLRCERRDALKRYLSEAGISSMVYYPSPLHLQPCFAELGYQIGALPEAEKAC